MVLRAAGWLAAAAGLAALSAVPARADSFDAWQKQTSDKGCYLYVYGSSVGGMDTDPNPDGFLWTGPCTAGQPINGTGTWYIQTNYPMGDGTALKRVVSMTGTVRNGLFEGYVATRIYEVDDNGRWDPNAGQVDAITGGVDVEYRAGCQADMIYEGQLAEYGCQPGTHGDAIVIPRVTRPYFPLPGATPVARTAPAQTVPVTAAPAPAPAARAPATYTTVGGVPAGPLPTFAIGQENALATVADGLLAMLGGSDGLGFANGEASIDTVIASLRTTLGLNANAALDGKAELMNLVLGEVRKALAGANPASTNGQVAQLVMGTVRQAIATGNKPPPAPAPASTPAGGRQVSASDVDSVIAYLASKGDSVTRSTDSVGDPMLTEASNRYFVYFYNCGDAHDRCDAIQLSSCYSNFPQASIGKLNALNRDNLWVKAYLDANGRVCLSQAMPTGAGIGYDAADLSFDAFLYFRQNSDTNFN
jgi:hypothetical protein